MNIEIDHDKSKHFDPKQEAMDVDGEQNDQPKSVKPAAPVVKKDLLFDQHNLERVIGECERAVGDCDDEKKEHDALICTLKEARYATKYTYDFSWEQLTLVRTTNEEIKLPSQVSSTSSA